MDEAASSEDARAMVEHRLVYAGVLDQGCARLPGGVQPCQIEAQPSTSVRQLSSG